MFQDKTVDSLHEDLLSNITDDYEKTIGYPTYDITKSIAIEGSKLYKALRLILNKVDVDTLTGDELEKFTKQRKGIVRKKGNAAKGILTVNGNGVISIGDLFETPSGIQFKSIETKFINGSNTIKILAVAEGSSGNVPANTIIQMPVTIPGITSVTNISATQDGYNQEIDDDLRDRYYDVLQKPSTSTNKNQYIKWAKEVVGVGEALCYPTWNGDNTVKVVIVDNNKEPANVELVERVQNYIDPKGEYDSLTDSWSLWGTGVGIAPMSAHCTVESAIGKEITIKVKVAKISDNYTDDEIKENIKAKVKSYFQDIVLDKDSNYVSYARIGNLVITSEGIGDYSNLTINDDTINIELSLIPTLNEVPVVKEVILL